MIEPTEDDVGRRVAYNGGTSSFKSRSTTGTLLSFDRRYVHVLYDGEDDTIPVKRKNLDWATQNVTQADSSVSA